MFAGTLAMLHRALRLDARLLRTHLFRLAFAGLVYLALLWAVISSRMIGAPGLQLFKTMSYLNLVLIVLAGVSFFATAITEEKEEETLPLLLLAGINPLGILLGKSTSRLVGTVLLLLVQLPFTLLAITLGGVTLEQVLAAYVALTAFMLLVANLGVFCSVACRRGGSASAMTLLSLSLYLLSALIVGVLKQGLENSGWIPARGAAAQAFDRYARYCDDASILTQLNVIMQTGFTGPLLGYHAWVSCGLAGLLFLAAWLGFRRGSRRGARAAVERDDLMARFVGLGRQRRSRPARQALIWKEFHFVTGGMPMQVAKFLVYGTLVFGTFWAAERYYHFTFAQSGRYVAWGMLGVMTLEACIYASRVFHDEWRGRTLPLLAMLPVRTTSIIHAKVLGCAPALLPAFFWLIAGCVIWPDGMDEFVRCLLLPSRWFYGLILLLFMTLTAFFSMIVRWGALPLAASVMIAGMFFSSCCGSPVVMMLSVAGQDNGTFEAGFAVVDLVILTLIVGLQFDVRRRVEIAATQ